MKEWIGISREGMVGEGGIEYERCGERNLAKLKHIGRRHRETCCLVTQV